MKLVYQKGITTFLTFSLILILVSSCGGTGGTTNVNDSSSTGRWTYPDTRTRYVTITYILDLQENSGDISGTLSAEAGGVEQRISKVTGSREGNKVTLEISSIDIVGTLSGKSLSFNNFLVGNLGNVTFRR